MWLVRSRCVSERDRSERKYAHVLEACSEVSRRRTGGEDLSVLLGLLLTIASGLVFGSGTYIHDVLGGLSWGVPGENWKRGPIGPTWAIAGFRSWAGLPKCLYPAFGGLWLQTQGASTHR